MMSYEEEYSMYKAISDHLRVGIRDKIKGYVKVHPKGKEDLIEIYIDNDGFVFEDYIYDVAEKAVNGYDWDKYVDSLCWRMKKTILKKYFHNKKKGEA